jgi:endonuclease YncB( thermonuclease family)
MKAQRLINRWRSKDWEPKFDVTTGALPQPRRIGAFHSTLMKGCWVGILGAAIAAAGDCCCAAAQDIGGGVACGGEIVAHATVNRVIDGRTFVLSDGHEVRLAAIEVPPLPLPSQSPSATGTSTREGVAAKAALDALIGGDDILLRHADLGLDHDLDRYGRMVAYAYALRDGVELFAQDAMVESGLARVADRVDSKGCAEELLAQERTARTAKLGLWGEPYYEVLNAEAPVDVLAQRGRFALVEGQVVSVRESGPTFYVNFGQRWSESFAVTISKRNERNFAAAGLDVMRLAGRRVRVRGWIEAHGADSNIPWMEAARPEQIEIADRN